MKKYLLTLAVALAANVSFAQVALTKQMIAVNELSPAVKSEVKTLDRQAAVKVSEAPARKVMGKKAPRRAAIGSIDELNGDFIVASYEYTVDSEGALQAATVDRKGTAATIEVTGENTINIYGIDANASEEHPIEATVDVENSTITIAPGQTIWVYTDGTVFTMENAEEEGVAITGTIYEGGVIALDQIWMEGYEEEGESYRNGNFKGTFLAPANGIMEYSEDGEPISQNVLIEQDDETLAVTVWNFHDFVGGEVVDINLNSDKTWSIPANTYCVYVNNGYPVYVWGFDGQYIDDVTGTATESELISDCGLAYIYTNGGYRGWTIPDAQFTITRTDDVPFEFPALEVGELVTLPEGLEAVDYPFSVTSGTYGAFTSTVKIAKDGTDVYFQGLDVLIPNAWVKGTYNESTGRVVIPVTYTGIYDNAVHYFAAYGGSDGPAALNLTYDANADTYEYGATVMIYKGTAASAAYAYYMNGFFIGTKPTPTTAPAGLQTVDMPFKAGYLTDDDAEDAEPAEVTGTVKVGWDGNDCYIQGLISEVEGGWIKGTRNGETVTFANNQYIGNTSNGPSVFLVGYSSEGVGDVVFTYNEEGNYFIAQTVLLACRSKNSTYYDGLYSKVTIGDAPSSIHVVNYTRANTGISYNLQGQRVSDGFKGLVIKNGRKVVVK